MQTINILETVTTYETIAPMVLLYVVTGILGAVLWVLR